MNTLSEIEIEHYEEFLQLADRLHIKINDVRNEIIDKSNCLEVLSVSNDSMLKEKAMSLTLENFNNVSVVLYMIYNYGYLFELRFYF